MAGAYLLDTREHVAGYLALRGYKQPRTRPARNEPPLRELLSKLFPAGVAATLALKPYTLGSVAHILTGMSRMHLAECAECLKAVKAHRNPFRATSGPMAAADPTALAELETALITSEMYLDSLRYSHGAGGHGSLESVMAPEYIDRVLRRAGWTPLQLRPHTQHAPSPYASSAPSPAKDETARPPAAEPEVANVGVQSIVRVQKRRRPAAQTDSSISLTERMLVREPTPQLRGTPTSSELAALDADTMELVLDSAIFPQGLPAPDEPWRAERDAFDMVQSRPVYSEAPDPHARNQESTAAELDFSLGDAAFVGVDAQLGVSPPRAGEDDLPFDDNILDVDADVSLPDSGLMSSSHLGPDDAQLSLSLPSSLSSPLSAGNGRASPALQPAGRLSPVRLDFDNALALVSPYSAAPGDGPDGRAQQMLDDGLDNDAPQTGSDDLFVADAAAPAALVTVLSPGVALTPARDLDGLHSGPPLETAESPTRRNDAILDDVPQGPLRQASASPHMARTTPPQSPLNNAQLAALSGSARRIPAVVRDADYAIPPPPTLSAASSASSASSAGNDEASAVHEPALPVPRLREREAAARAAVDDDINMSSDSEVDLVRLERDLHRDRIMYTADGLAKAVWMREDSPGPAGNTAVDEARHEQRELRPASMSELAVPAGRETLDVQGGEAPAETNNYELALVYEGHYRNAFLSDARLQNEAQAEHTDGHASARVQIAAQPAHTSSPRAIDADLSPAVDAPRPRDGSNDGEAGDSDFELYVYDENTNYGPTLNHGLIQEVANTGTDTDDESFVLIENSDLSGMPYPSRLTSEEQSPRTSEVAGIHDSTSRPPSMASDLEQFLADASASPRPQDDARCTVSSSASNDSDLNLLHASSLPSLPLLDASSPETSVPVTLDAATHPAVAGQPVPEPPTMEQRLDQSSRGRIDAYPGDEDLFDGDGFSADESPAAELPPVQTRTNTQAWQSEPRRPSAGFDAYFTPAQRALRQRVDPSPFWQLREDELSDYVENTMAAADRVPFTSLCEQAPWRTGTIEDFNLDSDLFHAVLGAACRQRVVLEQDTSHADAVLIVASAAAQRR